MIVLGGSNPMKFSGLVRVEAGVLDTSEYFVLVCVGVECLATHFLYNFAEQQEAQVGVCKLGPDGVLWFRESDIV